MYSRSDHSKIVSSRAGQGMAGWTRVGVGVGVEEYSGHGMKCTSVSAQTYCIQNAS